MSADDCESSGVSIENFHVNPEFHSAIWDQYGRFQLLQIAATLGNFHVDSRYHATSVDWNMESIRKIPPP